MLHIFWTIWQYLIALTLYLSNPMRVQFCIHSPAFCQYYLNDKKILFKRTKKQLDFFFLWSLLALTRETMVPFFFNNFFAILDGNEMYRSRTQRSRSTQARPVSSVVASGINILQLSPQTTPHLSIAYSEVWTPPLWIRLFTDLILSPCLPWLPSSASTPGRSSTVVAIPPLRSLSLSRFYRLCSLIMIEYRFVKGRKISKTCRIFDFDFS